MKDKIARTLIYLLLGLLACHIKMLGCYPFCGSHIWGVLSERGEQAIVCAVFLFVDGTLFADRSPLSLRRDIFSLDGGTCDLLAYAYIGASHGADKPFGHDPNWRSPMADA